MDPKYADYVKELMAKKSKYNCLTPLGEFKLLPGMPTLHIEDKHDLGSATSPSRPRAFASPDIYFETCL